MPEAEHSAANKVQGCASQVWLSTPIAPDGAGEPVLTFSATATPISCAG